MKALVIITTVIVIIDLFFYKMRKMFKCVPQIVGNSPERPSFQA